MIDSNEAIKRLSTGLEAFDESDTPAKVRAAIRDVLTALGYLHKACSRTRYCLKSHLAQQAKTLRAIESAQKYWNGVKAAWAAECRKAAA